MVTFVSDANIASNAAISVSKIVQGGTNQVLFSNGATNTWSGSPTVTSTVATSFLAIGTTPASSGGLRIANNNSISYRDQGDTTDLVALILNNSDNIVAGNDTSTNFDIRAASNVRTFAGGTQTMQLGNNAADFIQMGGSSPATVGQLRFNHNNTIQGRNSTNGSDRILFEWGTIADSLRIGAGANNTIIDSVGASNPVIIRTGGTTRIQADSAEILLDGYINANQHILGNLAEPIGDTDAATKFYVDSSGGASSLSAVLAVGNTTGGTPILVSAGDYTAYGTTPATVGTIRLPHASTIQGRNSTNSADRALIDWGATTTDQLLIGDSNVAVALKASATGVFIQTGGSSRVSFTNSLMTIQAGVNIQYVSAHTGPTINQADLTTGSGTGGTFTIQAQNETGATSTGGQLKLQSGTGTSTNGVITFYNGTNLISTIGAGFQSFGSAPAAAGTLRLENGSLISWRDNADSVDAATIECLSSDNTMQLTASVVTINDGYDNVWDIIGGTSITGSGILINKTISAGSGPITPLDTAPSFTINGWDATDASKTGGLTLVRGGNGDGATSTGGELRLQSGTGTSTNGVVNIYNSTTLVSTFGAGYQSFPTSNPAASTGTIRLAKDNTIYMRNDGDSADNIFLAYTGASNIFQIGPHIAGGATLSIGGNSNLLFYVSGTQRLGLSSSALTGTSSLNTIAFTGSVASQTIGANDTSGTPLPLRIKAAGKVVGTGDGADLYLEGGKFNTSGVGGATRIRYNPDNASQVDRVVVDYIDTSLYAPDGYVNINSDSANWSFIGLGTQGNFVIAAATTDPTIYHLPAAAASDLTIEAQSATGASTIGGGIVLRPGSGTTRDGAVSLRSNGVQLKVTEFATSQVAVAFFKDATITDITGDADKVIYIGDVDSAPTTSTPVNGFLHYSENGIPTWRTGAGRDGAMPFSESGSAGSHASYLDITVNGTAYKIDLLATS